ncbi:MAG: hypothetical protein M3O36_05530 [Myxococcota bacterium]|nr:hypothetical protein [Myxococcota bacterium]
MIRPFFTFVPGLLGAAVGCSSPPAPASDGGSCTPFASTADLSGGVSFSVAVMPILQHSCGLGGQSCHGAPSVTASGRPYLGSPAGGTTAALVLQQIVGVLSTEDTSMMLVAPGDPGHSFLMHKIDGDQCTLAPQCKGSLFPDCGQQMPWNSGTIDMTSRDAIRAWINQGAQNN